MSLLKTTTLYVTLSLVLIFTCVIISIDLWLQGGKPSFLNRALKNGLLNQRIHLFSAKFRLLTERALHEFASKNISRNLSAIGTYVNVNMEDEQVTEVIMLDD